MQSTKRVINNIDFLFELDNETLTITADDYIHSSMNAKNPFYYNLFSKDQGKLEIKDQQYIFTWFQTQIILTKNRITLGSCNDYQVTLFIRKEGTMLTARHINLDAYELQIGYGTMLNDTIVTSVTLVQNMLCVRLLRNNNESFFYQLQRLPKTVQLQDVHEYKVEAILTLDTFKFEVMNTKTNQLFSTKMIPKSIYPTFYDIINNQLWKKIISKSVSNDYMNYRYLYNDSEASIIIPLKLVKQSDDVKPSDIVKPSEVVESSDAIKSIVVKTMKEGLENYLIKLKSIQKLNKCMNQCDAIKQSITSEFWKSFYQHNNLMFDTENDGEWDFKQKILLQLFECQDEALCQTCHQHKTTGIDKCYFCDTQVNNEGGKNELQIENIQGNVFDFFKDDTLIHLITNLGVISFPLVYYRDKIKQGHILIHKHYIVFHDSVQRYFFIAWDDPVRTAFVKQHIGTTLIY